MKKIAEMIADFALVTAKEAAGAASQWAQCQPEEPAELKAMIEE